MRTSENSCSATFVNKGKKKSKKKGRGFDPPAL
jgi:hypothetical protein